MSYANHIYKSNLLTFSFLGVALFMLKRNRNLTVTLYCLLSLCPLFSANFDLREIKIIQYLYDRPLLSLLHKLRVHLNPQVPLHMTITPAAWLHIAMSSRFVTYKVIKKKCFFSQSSLSYRCMRSQVTLIGWPFSERPIAAQCWRGKKFLEKNTIFS